MNTITVSQLGLTDRNISQIIDVRKAEDYIHGTFPGAVNIPLDELESRKSELDRDKDIYLFGYTGRQTVPCGRILEAEEYRVCNVEGGWRAYLRADLERMVSADEEQIALKTREIERSIIKKFRKQLWSKFTRAVSDYDLIQEGDRIAVCISGGKDSMLLAKLMQELQRHGNKKFEIVYLCMNPGYNEDNWEIIQNNAKLLGIDLTAFESRIFDAVVNIDKNPCYLCARMRRGYLYNNARIRGCNKIALGHHFDDMIETTLMGMFYAGKIETMMPKLHSRHFEGMELIRPMYMIHEEDVKAWRDYNGLHFIQCACHFTEELANASGETRSKRAEMKELVARLREKDPNIDANIFRSLHDINLRTVIGYHKDYRDGSCMRYNFLDDYEEW